MHNHEIAFCILLAITGLISGCQQINPTPTATATTAPTPTTTASPTMVPLTLENLQVALGGDWNLPNLLAPQERFPVGTSFLWATLDYSGALKTELEWNLYEQNVLIDRGSTRLMDSEGTQAIFLEPEDGFQEGNYKFEVIANDGTSVSGEFEVLWLPTVWPIAISEEISMETSMGQEVVDYQTEFESGTEFVYASFPMSNIEKDSRIKIAWYFNNELYAMLEYVWSSDIPVGMRTEKLVNSENPEEPLPDGFYTVEISINGEIARFTEFYVGDW